MGSAEGTGARISGCNTQLFAGLVAASLVISGCSAILVQGPRDDYGPRESVNCTSSYELPLLDTALAAASLGSYALLSGTRSNSPITGDTEGPGANLSLLGVGIFSLSAVIGVYQIGKCRSVLGADTETVHHTPPQPRTQPSLSPPAQPDAGATPADASIASPILRAVPQQVDDEDAPTRRRAPRPATP